KTAKLGLPETTLGLIPGWTGTQILPKLIGEKKAIELILTGNQITGEEAEKIGLINIAVEEEKLEEKTMEIAKRIMGNAPIAIQKAKKLVIEAEEKKLEEGLKREAEEFKKIFETEDLKEGLKAFKEKRKPIYKGR
ncbi:MAG: enoyl-CoA hydratase-related protein, partial [Candidatus Methanomethylicia archaeon]